MKAMENKQKAIEKAYGEHWEAVKDYVDENGWVHDNKLGNRYKLFYEIFKGEMEVCDGLIRHISLQGIETNNGWIKIESEDIYDDWFTAWVFSEGIILYATWNPNQEYWLGTDMCLIENVTHYQPIVKPQNPIY